MSRKALLAIAGTLMVVGTVAAVSQPGPRWHRGGEGMFGEWSGHKGRHARGPHRGMSPMMRLKALDADHDGTITLAEFLAPSDKRFTSQDKNGDGAIDATEAGAAVRERYEFAMKRMLHRFDKDKDGKISLEEFRRSARDRFSLMDLDDDGTITAADMPPRMRDRIAAWKERREARKSAKDGETATKAPDAKAPDTKAPDAKGEDASGPKGKRGRGPVTLDRMLERRDAAFKRLDRNGDGFIDKADMDAIVNEHVDYWVRRFMHRYDQNKDGKVTKDEYQRFSRERFAMLDLNDDGKITEDDLAPWMRGRGILK
jgi:Ca2+-binding EF-hand superfamily protein